MAADEAFEQLPDTERESEHIRFQSSQKVFCATGDSGGAINPGHRRLSASASSGGAPGYKCPTTGRAI
jgi:hypothetical protein